MENNFKILDQHFDSRIKVVKRNCIIAFVLLTIAVLSLPHAFAQSIKPKPITYRFKAKQMCLPKLDKEIKMVRFNLDTIKTMYVTSAGKTIKITSIRAENIVSEMRDELANSVMKTSPTAIKNNYIADYILATWKRK